MLTVTICDNVCVHCTNVYDMMMKYLDRHKQNSLVKTYTKATELYNDPIPSNIYVLDIGLSELSGRELAIRLHEKYPHAQFIFMSKDAERIKETYDTEYVAYLLKPLDEKYLGLALDKAIKQLRREVFVVHIPGGERQVRYDEVVYANQVHRALEYYLSNGEVVRTVCLSTPAKQAYGEIVEKEGFVFLAPSLVLNLAYIKTLYKDRAEMYSGEMVYFTKRHYAVIREKWKKAIGVGVSGAEYGFY